MLLTREFTDHEYLMMVTRGGTVKRIRLDAPLYRPQGRHPRPVARGRRRAHRRPEDERQRQYSLATRQGMAICFAETDVRPMGRDAAGVRGIRLDDGRRGRQRSRGRRGQEPPDCHGERLRQAHGPSSPICAARTASRRRAAARAWRNYRLTEKTGLGRRARPSVDDTNDVMLIESGGVVLRTPAASINLYGRDTQGVILMRIEEGNRVIGVEAISNTEETEESGED